MNQSAQLPWRHFLLWHLLAVLALMLGASIIVGAPPWLMKQEEHFFVGAFLGAYVISVLLPSVGNIRSGRPQLLFSAMLAALMFGLVYLALENSGLAFRNRVVLRLAISMLFITLILLPFFQRGRIRQGLTGVLLIGALLLWAVGLSGVVSLFRDKVDRDDQPYFQKTAYYNLKIRQYSRPFHTVDVSGGGLAVLGSKYLLATGDGYLYVFDFNEAGALEAQRLTLRAPYNPEEFAASAPNGVDTQRFRVGGVAARMVDDAQFEIYLTHHYWYADQLCFVERVSRVKASLERLENDSPSLTWETVFETNPCLSLFVGDTSGFYGHIFGGQLAFIGDDKLLLTVGDHKRDGVSMDLSLAQDPEADYGKTILIDLPSGDARHFTSGHRNPQGLAVLENGEIWSLEHGPQGGDELNRLVDGANYGWPAVTYGTDYGHMRWPTSATQGRHDGYTKPVYSWVPSVATTALIQIKRPLFHWWQGDLLAATLHDGKLYRLRIEDQRVVLAEPITVGGWDSRDVIEGADGRIIVWSDTEKGVIRTIEPIVDGEAANNDPALAFASRCAGCHSIGDGSVHGIGPDLAGVVSRKIGTAEGYQYSQVLSSMDSRWTNARLDAFLADPQAFAPGSAMRIEPLTDADERAAVIRYLESQ